MQHELLSGSKYLKLWDIQQNNQKLLWSRELATQVHTAIFSPDSYLIASIGFYDQNVKIWSRLSFDLDNLDFDFTYLPHRQLLTSIRWRQSLYPSQSIDNTLFTSCEDNVLRIWQPSESADSSNLQLWYSIDLFQGETPKHGARRFGFIMDNGDVTKAIENTLTRANDVNDPSIRRVVDLAQLSPDVCVILKEDNTMGIYALENLGHKYSKLISCHPIVSSLKLPSRFPIDSPHLMFFPFFNSSFTKDVNDDRLKDLSIIVHDYRGSLLHYTAYLDRMIDPKIEKKHLSLKTILTGHNKSVQRLLRTADGQNVLSLSRFSENYVWTTHKLEGSVTLKRKSIISPPQNKTIEKATILKNGEFLLTLLKDKILLWDCKEFRAINISDRVLERQDRPIRLITLPESEQLVNGYHVIAIYGDKTGHLWQINLPIAGPMHRKEIIEDLGSFNLPMEEEMLTAVRVDPVGWNATINYDLGSDQRVVMATMSPGGIFRSWTASVCDGTIGWLQIGSIDTGIKNSSRLEVSSINKVAITCSTANNLSIWDMKNQLLEFEQKFDTPVSDLDWTGTPDSQGILAVGLTSEVVLYSQLRFDYTNKSPCWTPVKRIDISMYTAHGIGDSIWLYGGCLAIGAGNQFFIADEEVDITDTNTKILIGSNRVKDKSKRYRSQPHSSLFEICAILNGPLPVYHPQLLIQSLFADKHNMVKRILVILLKKIKFAIVLDNNVVDITSTLGLDPETLLDLMKEKSESKENFSMNATIEDHEQPFDNLVAEQLQEWLQKVSLPYLTQHQQVTLASVIEGVSKVQSNLRSLDSNGIKFLLGYRLFLIHRGVQESMTIRDFNWAMHSESQDIIFDMIKTNSTSAFMWPAAKDTGLAYWLRTDKLREVFEILGRNHFIQNERDPTKCTLYYLALRKKQVLLGLWRTASWHREQAKTIKLLSNDFTTERWKTAALKNAYVLLGKHRFEYAACFFLLGDSLRDACNVIVKNMEDVNLAIAVARVYGGDDHSAFLGLLERHILPKALIEGDRWTTSWALWRLGDRETSIQALVKPPRDIIEKCDKIKMSDDAHKIVDNKSFLVDDPVLIVLYRSLRKQNIKLFLGAVQLNSSDEFQFVLKTANIYRRMGCDILALSLLLNWSFVLDKAVLNGLTTPSSIPSLSTTPKPTENTSTSTFNFPSSYSAGSSLVDHNKLRHAVAARRSSLFGGNVAAAAAFAALSASPLPQTVDGKNGSTNGLINGSIDSQKSEGRENENTEKTENPFKNFKPAPAVAFQEPDMSSFNFGF